MINDPIAVWMRRIQEAEGYYTADRPPEVGFEMHGGHPRNEIDPESNPWASEYINCFIERANIEKCKGYIIDPKDVPDKDKIMVAMIRECQDDWEEKTEDFFASIPNLGIGSVDMKEAAKEALMQAQARGLSDEKADRINDDYDLPMISAIGR